MQRRVIAGIVAGVAVVAIGAGIAAWTLTRPPSADDVADRYLRALSNGDFAAIAPLLPESVDAGHLETAFAGATAHLTDYAVTLTGDGDAVSARADVRLGGADGVVVFGLARTDDGWTLAQDFLASLEVSTTLGDSVLVGDALAPADEPIALLPAVYPVSAAPAGILEGDIEVTATNDEPVTAALDPTLAPSATDIAQRRLDDYAAQCTAPAATIPERCGLRAPWAADLRTLDAVAFRVETLPSLRIADDGRSFAATGGAVVATVTGTTRAGSAASFTYRSEDWSMYGTVRFEGEQMVLLVD